ncbi:MAG TPA: DNA mismatch repair protein MutS [Thermodesulfobacteriota bacterium]|nr:DNA mismatch repair protein MutS [Thermodesulfobacteriota bacterium]
MTNITPAMRQYLDLKAKNSDAVLFFRMGDFYEMFFEDAKTASRVLGIALTSRDKNREIPMCGVPYHAAATYIARLVKEGLKVAVCEQIEDPNDSKGIVGRAVTRVITPGVTIDDELLDPRTNNFIASVSFGPRVSGLAYMDVSTGEFRAAEFSGAEEIRDEIRRIHPLELIVSDGAEDRLGSEDLRVKKVTPVPKYGYEPDTAAETLTRHFGTTSLEGFGLGELKEAVKAAGALLGYIKSTQKSELSHIKKCVPYSTGEYLIIDHSTRRNLEITENIRTGGKEGTLLETLDRTKTAMGARLLKSWLLHPLKDKTRIGARQSAVGELIEMRDLRGELQELLNEVYDLERLMVRVSLKAATPKDLVSLRSSLEKIPSIKRTVGQFSSPLIADMSADIDPVEEAEALIGSSVVDSPPYSVKDGGVVREGYDPALDELRSIGAGGKDWIARLERDERARTGINSLKVGYNRVFGYYIEVTKTNLSSVPDDYIRKQTLTNAERYITPALKEWEERILTAEEKARELEASIFANIVESLSKYSERVQKTAGVLASLDALSSLAEAAERMNYAMPTVNDGDSIEIEGGRHPVIEAGVKDFVPNDLLLDGSSNGIIILTGPNMAGKSTYLRQNALIVLMAQIGSFVPASKAVIGAVDRIFTRVGASDDLARGHSTFMVEMNEAANILNNATGKSLIILDEIGRGTSTFDGLSIAWAVVEYIHDNPELKAKTLFATHYHELTDLSLTKERVKNYNMAVKEWNERIIFLRKVVPGGSSRSYGIQVARLAGLPAPVISRALEILRNLETGELNDSGLPRLAFKREAGPDAGQMTLFGERDPVRERLREMEPDSMTPLEALTELHKLK